MWDVTVANTANNCIVQGISTHTSRVGCDEIPLSIWRCKVAISTHTSRVGCDIAKFVMIVIPVAFLLTHPVWDVTMWHIRQESTPRISTHTSRVGCDYSLNSFVSDNVLFLLTHPVWDVT